MKEGEGGRGRWGRGREVMREGEGGGGEGGREREVVMREGEGGGGEGGRGEDRETRRVHPLTRESGGASGNYL